MKKMVEGAEDRKMFQKQMFQTNQMMMIMIMNNMNTIKSKNMMRINSVGINPFQTPMEAC